MIQGSSGEVRCNAARIALEHASRTTDRRYHATLHVMWMLVLIACVLLVTCCAHAPKMGRTLAEEHTAAVRITAICDQTNGKVISVGSGVIVTEHVVLTAAHVIHPSFTLTVGDAKLVIPFTGCTFAAVTQDDTSHALHLSKEWPDQDVARLVTIRPLPYIPVELADAPPAGEDVCIVARAPWRTRRCGELQYFLEAHGFRHITGVIIQPGNSGSGVYDKRGRLIGITVVLFTCANGQWCEGAFSPLSNLEGGVL
jgi:S1-C subfamily serine protease